MDEPLHFRPAHPGDYPAYAKLFVELGIDDRVPDAIRFCSKLLPRVIVAARGDAVVGYALLQVLKGTGYLRQIVVAPEARGSGVGRALMRHLAAELRTRGATGWCLNVRPDNARAIRLYESMGLGEAYRSAAIRFPWTVSAALPPTPEGVVGAPIAPDGDAAVEARFDVARGLLADSRRRGRVLVRLDEQGEPVGLAVFDPGFPGAFPFRVARPALAGALLAALAPYARPDQPTMQVVVEDDPGLFDLLITAGARVRLELLHYRGALADAG